MRLVQSTAQQLSVAKLCNTKVCSSDLVPLPHPLSRATCVWVRIQFHRQLHRVYRALVLASALTAASRLRQWSCLAAFHIYLYAPRRIQNLYFKVFGTEASEDEQGVLEISPLPPPSWWKGGGSGCLPPAFGPCCAPPLALTSAAAS